MLPEDEVPDQVDEVAIVYTHIIERNTYSGSNFMGMSAAPEEMPSGLSSQVGSASTPREQRFALVGRIFRQALHAKVFSLFGI